MDSIKRKNINTVVFDCDGVMFMTGELNRHYYNSLLSRFGKPDMSDEQFEFVKMHTGDDSVRYLFGNDADMDEVNKERKRVPYSSFVSYMEMTEGLEDLLVFLKSKSFYLGIATNRTNTMDLVLDTFNLKEYFDIVVTAWDVKNAKPAPDQLNEIKKRLGVADENIIYIGDSKVDEEAAMESNVKFISFDNDSLEADYHVKSMKELRKIIEGCL